MNTEDEDALAALREFGFAETSKNKGSVGGARPIPRSDDRRTTIGSGLTPEQRTIRARVGAYALHAQGGTSTKAGTAAFMALSDKSTPMVFYRRMSAFVELRMRGRRTSLA